MPNCPFKKNGVLGNDTNLFAQAVDAVVIDVVPINQDLTRIGLEKARDQAQEMFMLLVVFPAAVGILVLTWIYRSLNP